MLLQCCVTVCDVALSSFFIKIFPDLGSLNSHFCVIQVFRVSTGFLYSDTSNWPKLRPLKVLKNINFHCEVLTNGAVVCVFQKYMWREFVDVVIKMVWIWILAYYFGRGSVLNLFQSDPYTEIACFPGEKKHHTSIYIHMMVMVMVNETISPYRHIFNVALCPFFLKSITRLPSSIRVVSTHPPTLKCTLLKRTLITF